MMYRTEKIAKIILFIILVLSVFILVFACQMLVYQIFTPKFSHLNKSYIFLSIGSILIAAISILLIYKVSLFIHYLKSFFSLVLLFFGQLFIELKHSDIKFLLIIPLCLYIYCVIHFPITYDEAYTYIIFAKPTLGTSIIDYTVPNNHILFSFIESIIIRIPYFDLTWRVRMPVVFFSILTWLIAFHFIKKYLSENAAFITIALSSVSAIIIQYSFFARGYCLALFFFVIGFYMVTNIICEGNRKRDWYVYAMSSILGLYTIPTFAYVFVALNVILLYFNYKEIKKQFFYDSWIIVITLLLYMPILINGGLDMLIGNEFIKPLERGELLRRLPGFIKGIIVDLYGLPYYISFIFLFLLIFYAFLKKDKNTFALWIIFGLTPIIMILLQSVLGYFRTFVYYGFIFVFLGVLTLRDKVKNLSHLKILVVLIIIQIIASVYFLSNADFRVWLYGEYAETISQILVKDGDYYLHNLDGLTNVLLFEADRNSYNIEIKTAYDDRVSADSIKGYTYTIINCDNDCTSIRKPEFTTFGPNHFYFNVYK